jgi:hypothetical protein
VYVGRAYIQYEDGELRCDLYFVTSKSRGSILVYSFVQISIGKVRGESTLSENGISLLHRDH